MLTKMKTASLQGVNGYPVTVETDLHRGMPGFQIVGLADTTIKEAFSRIRPAIINSGYRFPREKVTVNLSPAGKPKEGSHFDLPIDHDTLFNKELTITAAYQSPYMFPRAIELIRKLNLDPFLSVVFPAEACEEAFAAHRKGLQGKVLMEFQ